MDSTSCTGDKAFDSGVRAGARAGDDTWMGLNAEAAAGDVVGAGECGAAAAAAVAAARLAAAFVAAAAADCSSAAALDAASAACAAAVLSATDLLRLARSPAAALKTLLGLEAPINRADLLGSKASS